MTIKQQQLQAVRELRASINAEETHLASLRAKVAGMGACPSDSYAAMQYRNKLASLEYEINKSKAKLGHLNDDIKLGKQLLEEFTAA